MCSKDLTKFMFLKKEYPENYPEEIIKAIKLLTINQKNIVIFGTSSLKSMIYAGDIDLIEMLDINKHYVSIRKIVKRILNNSKYGINYQIGDIKCGRYPFGDELMKSLGTLENNNIIDYNYNDIIDIFDKYDIKDYPKVHKKPNIYQWVELYKFCHNLETLRWSVDEIIKGKHKESGISLKNACLDSLLTKVDLYFYVAGKFMEITVVLNGNPEMKADLESLKINLATYLFDKEPNYLKSIKRANAISRLTNNCVYMNKVKNFLVGQTALLNSVKTDLDVLPVMFEFGYKINKNNRTLIKSHIGQCIIKLSNIYSIDVDDNIFDELKKIQKNFNNSSIKIIENIVDEISKIVNNQSLKFIKDNSLNLRSFI